VPQETRRLKTDQSRSAHCFCTSIFMPTGSVAGHAVLPTTPVSLVHDIEDDPAAPLTLAFPLQAVPSSAVPVNVSWPVNELPLIVPVMFPCHITELESQVPETAEEDCVSTIRYCIV
jgi:hypothetical protein